MLTSVKTKVKYFVYLLFVCSRSSHLISRTFGMSFPTPMRKNCLLSLKLGLLTLLIFAWSGQQELSAQVYCTSGATSQFDSNCELVVFNTINNNTAGVCGQYSDFTAQSTAVNLGSTVAISVRPGTCGGNFTKHFKVYIDYNQNGLFTDPGEEVFTGGPIVAPTTVSGNVTVPVNAVVGSTTMRVVVEETGILANVTPCGSYTWGETEDYTVLILPSSPNDMGITSISSPTSGCNLTTSETVTVNITNFGTNAQTGFNVFYSINGGTPVSENVGALSLNSAQTLPYTFTNTANLGTSGTYTICAWTDLPLDTVSINDTSCTTVIAVPGISTYPYLEDFESGQGGWISGGTANSWAYGNPSKTVIQGAASGSNAWVTGGLGTGNYSASEDSYVIGPCFDFSSLQNPWVSMKIWWNSEFSWDGAVLQSSIDFGQTWQNVGAYLDPFNWYTDNSVNGNPGGSQDAWTGRNASNNGSGGYVNAAHRLDGLAGQASVRLRIAFGSDASVSDDGFAFDDFTIGEGPVANLGPDQLICTGDSVVIDAGAFAGYNWTTGDTTRMVTITNQSAGMIIVRVEDSLGFYDIDTVMVAQSNPFVDIGPDSTICPGDTVLLNAAWPGATYVWSQPTNDSVYAATSGGTYWVEITDSVGCKASDTMSLTLQVPPQLDLGNDTTVCVGEPVILDAGPGPIGTSYNWSSGQSTRVVIVTSAGSYGVAVTTPGGCSAIDTLNVAFLPAPAISLGPDRVECGAFTLNAGAGATSYLWSTGATTQSISSATPGGYAVTVTNNFNCQSTDSVNITVGNVPQVSLGQDQVLCNGATIPLDAGNPGATYQWSNGQVSQTINVTVPSTYIANVTNAAGCTGSDTIVITQSNLTVSLGPDVSICGNDPITLQANSQTSSFLWSNNSTNSTLTISSGGVYWVEVTDAQGCTARDSVIATQRAGITGDFTLPPAGTLFQQVQFFDATTPTPFSWAWDFGDGNTSTVQNPTHTYQALATFPVTLIVSDGFCNDTIVKDYTVSNTIGIEEESFISDLKLYPNPSDGIFNLDIEFFDPSGLEIAVFDISGKQMYQSESAKSFLHREKIDLSAMPKGVYLLRLNADSRVTYRKLILN